MKTSIKIAHSNAADAKLAVQQLFNGIASDSTELVIFFCSSDYELDAMAEAFNILFPHTNVIGCTSAGEIGPQGYITSSLVGVSFDSAEFKAVVTHFEAVDQIDADSYNQKLHQLKTEFEQHATGKPAAHRFALQLIDGLSNSEELFTFLAQRGLGDIPLIGGSAGDDLKFISPQIFCNGRFYPKAAVLAILETIRPIKIFKTQHFIDGNEPLVVTAADVASRRVIELNGLPAAQEYARSLGVKITDLNDTLFAGAPVVVHLNGNEYVRSIRQVHPDGSLSFYCAIERGLILRIAHGVDVVKNLDSTYQEILASVGTPDLVLVFECIFRRLELDKKRLTTRAEEIMQANHTVGFSTYGEQFLGIHVNQTLTGIAIGSLADE